MSWVGGLRQISVPAGEESVKGGVVVVFVGGDILVSLWL